MADLDLTEAVDAAAQALRCSWSPPEPEHPDEQACRMQGMCVDQAARVVEAAAPLIAAQVSAEALREAADAWTQGAWADTPRRADRVQDRIAAAQYVGDWLLALAAAPTEEDDRG